MADIATAVVSKLASVAGVTALIENRVYPSYDRQTDRTDPLAVYSLDITPITDFDGPTGVMTAVLEIAAIAETYAEAVALGKAIYAALEFQSGDWGGVTVQGCFMQDEGERDDKVTDPTSEEILFFVKSFRFDLTFNA
jgi:hypothetical protein